MSASYLFLDDLDTDFVAVADDDIGDSRSDFVFDFGDDVMSFDASDMAGGSTLTAPLYAIHSGLSDDELLEVWFRLQEAGQEPLEAVSVELVDQMTVEVAIEPVEVVDEAIEAPATVEVIAMSAYALAKAALASMPIRRRRSAVADERQLALF